MRDEDIEILFISVTIVKKKCVFVSFLYRAHVHFDINMIQMLPIQTIMLAYYCNDAADLSVLLNFKRNLLKM